MSFRGYICEVVARWCVWIDSGLGVVKRGVSSRIVYLSQSAFVCPLFSNNSGDDQLADVQVH